MKPKNLQLLRFAIICLLGIGTATSLHARRVNIHIQGANGCSIDIVGEADGGGLNYQNFTGTVTFGGGPDCPNFVMNFKFVSPPSGNDPNPNQPVTIGTVGTPGITSYFIGGSNICTATSMVFSGHRPHNVNPILFQDAIDLMNLNSKVILENMKRDVECE